MIFDTKYFGPQGLVAADLTYHGSRFSELRAAMFSNAYYKIWGAAGNPSLPTYGVTLGRALSGVLPFGERWRFQQAAHRAVGSRADLRWGFDHQGFRRILHPNGVCLFGRWEIDEVAAGTTYTGYFAPGSRGLVVGRYSTCCTETRRGHYRSLSLVGKIFQTLDTNHAELLRPANFITQEDLGGNKTAYINDAELRNAPDTSPWRRGAGAPIFLLTALVLLRADKKPAVRQVYEIAELGKPANVPTRAPEFMRFLVDSAQPRIAGEQLDFRDEILAQIYDPGDPSARHKLTFHIEVSDEGRTVGAGVQRVHIKNWKRIGRVTFEEAVASYNGDFVLHFPHPQWRNDRNDPASLARTKKTP